MKHPALFLAVTLVAAISPLTIRSQVTTPKANADESAAVLRKKAFKLLGSIAEQVGSLQSSENRARIASNVADLLWEEDEKLSRDLMQSVAQDLRTWASEIEPDDVEDMRELGTLVKLRSDIIGRLAKRDLEAALDFLRATRLPAPVDLAGKQRRGADQFFKPEELDNRLELQLAQQAAGKNPKFSLQLGRELIMKNLSPDLLPLLSELRHRDAAMANTFYKMIVEQLRETPRDPETPATALSFELARAVRPPAVDEQVYRSLLGMVLAAAIRSHCDNQGDAPPTQDCYQIGYLLPALEKYYGSQTASLKQWELSATEVDRMEGWERVREVEETGTIDEMLTLAAKYPDLRDHLNWAAMQKAETAGDLAAARKIAESQPAEASRRSMLARVEELHRWESINAEKLTALQQTLSELPNDEQRTSYIFEVVRNLAENDRKAALGLMDQAGQMVERAKSPRARLVGQAGLALLYGMLKSDRGFPILEALMPRLNELVAASIQLDGLELNYVRQGEWNMSSEGIVGGILVGLAQNAEYFARIDFDRSVALTNQLQRSELRLMAQEKIAQGILAPTDSLSTKVTPPVRVDDFRVRDIRY